MWRGALRLIRPPASVSARAEKKWKLQAPLPLSKSTRTQALARTKLEQRCQNQHIAWLASRMKKIVRKWRCLDPELIQWPSASTKKAATSSQSIKTAASATSARLEGALRLTSTRCLVLAHTTLRTLISLRRAGTWAQRCITAWLANLPLLLVVPLQKTMKTQVLATINCPVNSATMSPNEPSRKATTCGGRWRAEKKWECRRWKNRKGLGYRKCRRLSRRSTGRDFDDWFLLHFDWHKIVSITQRSYSIVDCSGYV